MRSTVQVKCAFPHGWGKEMLFITTRQLTQDMEEEL